MVRHGPQPLNGRQAQLLWRIYPFTDKGLAAGKLDALGDSKSHESGPGCRAPSLARSYTARSAGSCSGRLCGARRVSIVGLGGFTKGEATTTVP